MALDDLKKDLYRGKQNRKHQKTVYNPDVARNQKNQLGAESPWHVKEKEGLGRSWRAPLLRIAIAFAIFIVGAFAVWTFMLVRGNIFDITDVVVEVSGPVTVTNGMSAEYVIKYTNDNSVSLKDAQLVFEHAPSFKIDDDSVLRYDAMDTSSLTIGKIKPHETREIVVRGHFDDSVAGAMYMNAELSFVPSTQRKRIVRSHRLGLVRSQSALDITVDAQKSVPNNSAIEYVVRYINNSAQTYESVVVSAQFPEGFNISVAEPEMVDGSWMIGTIAPGEEGVLRVRGALSGVFDDVKIAKFSVSAQMDGRDVVVAREEWVTRIALPALVIRQLVNGGDSYIARPGEVLRYSLMYQNTSDLGMRDVVVRLKLDDEILDYSTLNVSYNGGSLDPATRSILWRASDVPGLALLAPGQGGQIDFEISVRKKISVRDDSDRNFVVRTIAEIDSPDVPTPIGENKIVSSNVLVLKLISHVQFDVEGFYDDFTLKNTGPIPPIVNTKTTFTIRWTLSNATNALRNARVEAFLPTSVSWEGVTFPGTEKVQFNPRTHKIIWDIGDVENGVGYFRKKREVRFQIGITPTINQAETTPLLLKESVFTAQDSFTGSKIRIVRPEKTTALPEDVSITSGNVIK